MSPASRPYLPPAGQWIICNSITKGHIWCAEFKFPDLSSRGLQSGQPEHCLIFACWLHVVSNSHWLNDTRMVHAWRMSIWFKINVLKWNDNCTVMLKIHIYIYFCESSKNSYMYIYIFVSPVFWILDLVTSWMFWVWISSMEMWHLIPKYNSIFRT